MNITEIKHPLIQHKLGLLRQENLCIKTFRELTQEIASFLTYEATRHLPLKKKNIQGWSANMSIEKIDDTKITFVPILRAGIGMLEGALHAIPCASISTVGIVRNEETLKASVYIEKLVQNIDHCFALILDPMLATGGTLISTVELLKKAGCKQISAITLVSVHQGIQALQENHPDVQLFTASIDKELNKQGYIIPGLGDAGDKLFGTSPQKVAFL